MLNPAQREVVDHYKALNVPAKWFEGEVQPDGAVEVIAIGLAGDWLWSFKIDANGGYSSAEAPVGDWSTGIEV